MYKLNFSQIFLFVFLLSVLNLFINIVLYSFCTLSFKGKLLLTSERNCWENILGSKEHKKGNSSDFFIKLPKSVHFYKLTVYITKLF